jgi:hypothetical protein
MLVVGAKSATVRCLPGERFLLTVRVGVRVGGNGDVLRRWRGKADARGQCRVPLAILGERKKDGSVLTLEVSLSDGGTVRSSRRITLEH